MRVAAPPLYDLPEIRGATDALWSAIARSLRERGERDAPDSFDRTRGYDEVWRDPALLFAQVCGYPLTHAYAGQVRIVATPCHALPGCEGGEYRSLVVVREGSNVERPGDLRGATLAINDHSSQSGKHALLSLLAEEVEQGRGEERFLAGVRITGSHVASIAAVSHGEADAASIDCITHALLARHRPRALNGTRVAFDTAFAPAPAYVTRATAGDDAIERLRGALSEAFADPALAPAREALLLCGIRVLDASAYDRILELERAHARYALVG
jgi:ABC-type phosphate/phosphonate transport system substrate-binding protein